MFFHSNQENEGMHQDIREIFACDMLLLQQTYPPLFYPDINEDVKKQRVLLSTYVL